MSTKNKMNTNNFNLNISELKGQKITINNDSNKYLILYPGDINFVLEIENLLNFVKEEFENLKDSNEDNVDNMSELEQTEYYSNKLKSLKEIISNIKIKFNNVFNDDEAYSRIFGNIADIDLILIVITKVYEYSVKLRENEVGSVSKYTTKYTNKYKK